jgi:hypothetical protein
MSNIQPPSALINPAWDRHRQMYGGTRPRQCIGIAEEDTQDWSVDALTWSRPTIHLSVPIPGGIYEWWDATTSMHRPTSPGCLLRLYSWCRDILRHTANWLCDEEYPCTKSIAEEDTQDWSVDALTWSRPTIHSRPRQCIDRPVLGVFFGYTLGAGIFFVTQPTELRPGLVGRCIDVVASHHTFVGAYPRRDL